MNLPARLDAAMRKAGYSSQSALARAAGVSQSSVNRILKESGPQGPDTNTIAKLAAACGVSADWLISGGEMSSTPQATIPMALVYLDTNELKIITHYREANLAGKRLIESIAENAQKKSDPTDGDEP